MCCSRFCVLFLLRLCSFLTVTGCSGMHHSNSVFWKALPITHVYKLIWASGAVKNIAFLSSDSSRHCETFRPHEPSEFQSGSEANLSQLSQTQPRWRTLLFNINWGTNSSLHLVAEQTPILRRSFRYVSIFTPLVYFSLRCYLSCYFGEDTDCVFEHKQPEISVLPKPVQLL